MIAPSAREAPPAFGRAPGSGVATEAEAALLERVRAYRAAVEGALAAGDEMRAHFAMFLDFEDGLIRGQRNYDCFEPF